MSAQTGATKDYRSDAYYAVYGPNAKYPVHLIGRWAYDPSLGIDTRATATYPRLTASSSGTDAQLRQDVDVLARRQNYFSIPAVQLSYHLGDKLMKTLRLKDVTIYARATDILLLLAFAGSDDPERGQRVPVRMGTPRSETEILTAKSRSLL